MNARQLAAILLLLPQVLIVGCSSNSDGEADVPGDGDGEADVPGDGDGDTTGPVQGAASLACCQSTLICENCACGSGETEAFSEDTAQCQNFLDAGAGCGDYSGTMALRDCAEAKGTFDPSDTSGADSAACCQARRICEECICGNSEAAAFSDNEELCEAFLDQGAGCENYPLSAALAECNGSSSGDGDGDTDPMLEGCDDAVDCTEDLTTEGDQCSHRVNHTLCPKGSYCHVVAGCISGDACHNGTDCIAPDSCIEGECDPASLTCRYTVIDEDGDGQSPISCGGLDCNDNNFTVYSGAPEACDMIDTNCDGLEDPSLSSGCHPDQTCISGLCECPQEKEDLCFDGCTDLDSDDQNCGTCGTVCTGGRRCVSGNCQCTDGLILCSSVCLDPTEDESNCGGCNLECGNAMCIESACECGADEIDCSSTNVPECANLTRSPRHCGACGDKCATGVSCSNSTCEIEVDWIRAYGSYDANPPYMLQEMAVMPNGDIFIGSLIPEFYHEEIPRTIGEYLFSGPINLIKLNADGDFVWAKEFEHEMQVVATDDAVYVAVRVGWNYNEVLIAGEVQPVGNEGSIFVVKIDPVDGHTLWAERFDNVERGHTPVFQMEADSQGRVYVAIELNSDDTLVKNALSWNPPIYHYGLLLRFDGAGYDASTYLPRSAERISIDPADNIVISVYAAPGVSNYGGDDLDAGGLGAPAIIRYAPDFSHMNSFIAPGQTIAAYDDGVVVVGAAGGPFLQKFVYTGAGATLTDSGNPTANVNVHKAYVKGGLIHVSGDLDGYQAYYLSANLADLSPHRLVVGSFVEPQTETFARKIEMAHSTDLSTLYLGGNFAGSAQFGHLAIDDHPYVHGVGIGKFTIH